MARGATIILGNKADTTVGRITTLKLTSRNSIALSSKTKFQFVAVDRKFRFETPTEKRSVIVNLLKVDNKRVRSFSELRSCQTSFINPKQEAMGNVVNYFLIESGSTLSNYNSKLYEFDLKAGFQYICICICRSTCSFINTDTLEIRRIDQEWKLECVMSADCL